MEQDSSVFVPGINRFCWEGREAESCLLEMVTPARFLLVLPKKHPAAVYLFISLAFLCPPPPPVCFVELQIAQGRAKGRALGHLPLQGGHGPSALSLMSCLSRCLLTCFLLFLHNSPWLMGVLLFMTPR